MTQDSERAAVESDDEDRISGLPSNVIDRILELLPVHDAARTSILSKKWRYIWAMLPNLELNKLFCEKLIAKSQFVFRETVDKILLQHIGDILEFVLDLSGAHLSSDIDFDRWMLHVTRHGVKELMLSMSNNSTYKLPSYIFDCPTLTCLELNNCVFKPPNSFLGFQNLRFLHLEEMTFVPTTHLCVINVPLLLQLTLKRCHGTQYLNIVLSQLEYLNVSERHYLKLNCFLNCKNLIQLHLGIVERVTDNPQQYERSTLEKLLSSSPTLEELYLHIHFPELLSADTVPFMPNNLWRLSLIAEFGKLSQIAYPLHLIKSSPNLNQLLIWVEDTSDNAEAVWDYLDTPACLDQPLNMLEDVHINWFRGSKTELLFIKLLLARTPYLTRMAIKPVTAFGSKKERNITRELMRFPRASPKAELLYSPDDVD